MARYLVTGAAGFIGFHLARTLADAGNAVVVNDDFSRGRRDDEFQDLVEKSSVEEANGDLADDTTYDGFDGAFDAVFHLAAVNGTRTFYEEPYRVLRTNILSTLKLVDWIRRNASTARLVTASSSEAYAGTIRLGAGQIPTSEQVPLSIVDPHEARYSYGGSKIADELLVINGLRDAEYDWTIVRFHNIYGPRMGYEHVIPEFLVRSFRRQDPFTLYGGNQTRTYHYIDDAVQALRRLAEAPAATKRIVNVGAAKPEITADALARLVHEAVGYAPEIDERGAPAGSVERRCPDVTLLGELTGVRESVDLREGLTRTAEWYEARLESAPEPKGFVNLPVGEDN